MMIRILRSLPIDGKTRGKLNGNVLGQSKSIEKRAFASTKSASASISLPLQLNSCKLNENDKGGCGCINRFDPSNSDPLNNNRTHSHPLRGFNHNALLSVSLSLEEMLESWDSNIPVESASTLPASFYTESAVYNAESSLIFGNNWLMAGNVASLRNGGDFITGTYQKRPWIVCKDEEGKLRAFYNVCRHHAMTVAHIPEGNTQEFVCGYHGWRYALNGRLKAAVGVKGIKDFTASKISLFPIELHVVGPFVYLNFGKKDKKEMSTQHLDEVDGILQSSRYGDLQFVKRLEYNLNCNWKVFVDNYLDGGMHVKYAHPGLASNLDLKSYSTVVHDKYSVQRASASVEKGEEVRVKGRADYVYVYPNLMINRYGDWMDTNLVIPLGPSQCMVRMDYYLEKDKVEQKEWIEESLKQSDQVQKEDVWLCETVQRGLESTVYSTGRYAPTIEHGMHDFHKTLFKELSQK